MDKLDKNRKREKCLIIMWIIREKNVLFLTLVYVQILLQQINDPKRMYKVIGFGTWEFGGYSTAVEKRRIERQWYSQKIRIVR